MSLSSNNTVDFVGWKLIHPYRGVNIVGPLIAEANTKLGYAQYILTLIWLCCA